MRKIEDFSNDHRGVEAKKVVLEIRKINSSICGFEGMYLLPSIFLDSSVGRANGC